MAMNWGNIPLLRLLSVFSVINYLSSVSGNLSLNMCIVINHSKTYTSNIRLVPEKLYLHLYTDKSYTYWNANCGKLQESQCVYRMH